MSEALCGLWTIQSIAFWFQCHFPPPSFCKNGGLLLVKTTAPAYLYGSEAYEGLDGVLEGALISLHEQTGHTHPCVLQCYVRTQDGLPEVWQLHQTAAHPTPMGAHT